MTQDPAIRIRLMIQRQVPIEMIYTTLECEYGVNYVYHQRTPLDNLLLDMQAHNMFDRPDEIFYTTAELALLIILGGAKCCVELSTRDIEQLDCEPLRRPVTHASIDTREHIFTCMMVDSLRFKYLQILKHSQPLWVAHNTTRLINIVLTNRNIWDQFDPSRVVTLYHELVGIHSTDQHGLTLRQMLAQKNLTFMRQVSELRELYKRTIDLIAEVNKYYINTQN